MLAIADMAPCQRWVVTDVLEGPWQDPEGELQRTAMLLQHINVLVLQNRTELVNVFRLQHVVESHGPFDLVVSFGSWPNVLTDDLCQHIRPGRQLRKLLARLQRGRAVQGRRRASRKHAAGEPSAKKQRMRKARRG